MLKKTIENEETNPTKLMNVIEKELNKVKFKSFGKVTVRNELKTTKEIKKLQNKKIEVLKGVQTADEKDQKIKSIEEEKTEKVLKFQRKHLETEIDTLKDMKKKKGKTAVIFNLKD